MHAATRDLAMHIRKSAFHTVEQVEPSIVRNIYEPQRACEPLPQPRRRARHAATAMRHHASATAHVSHGLRLPGSSASGASAREPQLGAEACLRPHAGALALEGALDLTAGVGGCGGEGRGRGREGGETVSTAAGGACARHALAHVEGAGTAILQYRVPPCTPRGAVPLTGVHVDVQHLCRE